MDSNILANLKFGLKKKMNKTESIFDVKTPKVMEFTLKNTFTACGYCVYIDPFVSGQSFKDD